MLGFRQKPPFFIPICWDWPKNGVSSIPICWNRSQVTSEKRVTDDQVSFRNVGIARKRWFLDSNMLGLLTSP